MSPSQETIGAYRELLRLKGQKALTFSQDAGSLALCPDMGGRVFAELAGESLHRIDLATAAHPTDAFNNFGGANFWPAPEGGCFAFNYDGETWRVQAGINNQPFEVISHDRGAATLAKHVTLANRKRTMIDVAMQRAFSVRTDTPPLLAKAAIEHVLSYQTVDSFEVSNRVSVDDAMIAAWTLEQFDATPNTVSFVIVNEPKTSINADFYEDPSDRIRFRANGFVYQTDGQRRGQIGIKVSSAARCVGFYDLSRRLLCVKENLNDPSQGVFFNIADNDQPQGPYSAADNYSIFNSDPDMRAFELETIGSANVENGMLRGSTLTSVTTFAIFERSHDLAAFVDGLLGE